MYSLQTLPSFDRDCHFVTLSVALRHFDTQTQAINLRDSNTASP